VSIRDRLQRRAVPRLVIFLSTVRWPARVAAAARRALGRPGRVRLHVGFDDPYSAVALLALVDRLETRNVDLVVEPVVERGIRGDPAVEAKREYALTDARRIARRLGMGLSRSAPVDPGATAFLARWAAAAPQGPARTAFCADAMRAVWLMSDGPVAPEPFAALWREHIGGEPPNETAGADPKLRGRGLYDTPAAVVHGQWFFAHERLEQIEHRLDELGWRVTA
jgi:2-hydroxychromene-2-carboxylate isomerase